MPLPDPSSARTRRGVTALLALAGVACLAAAATAQTPPGAPQNARTTPGAQQAQSAPAPRAQPARGASAAQPAPAAPPAPPATDVPAGMYRVDLHVRGVRGRSGFIRGGLYDGPRKWAEEPGSMAHCAAPVRGSEVVCAFTIPARPGVYAAAFYHDENANDHFDTGFLGIPKEGYAFSRNPSVVLSRPSYSSAAFRLPATRLPVATMRY